MSNVYPQGGVGEPELGPRDEYDRFSLDDAGTDCSCSTCSSCSSTCSFCGEEDGACGSSCCDDDEYGDDGDATSRGYLENHVINGRVVGRRAMRHRNEASSRVRVGKTEGPEGTRPFPEERLLEFGGHGQGKVCREANGIHNNNSFGSSTSSRAITLRLEEMSLQGSWSRHSPSSMQDKKRKKVTFIDSSSSSDEMMLAEQFSMSSDNSATGYSPCHCSANDDAGQRGNQISPANETSDKHRRLKTPIGDLSVEYSRLKNVLKTIDPSKLHSVLKHALKSKRTESIVALATLLPKSKFTADTIHCVRCHKEFDPIYGKKQCALPHPERSVVKVSQDSEGADFECTICRGSFRLKGAWDYKLRLNAEQDCGVCFIGKHTPNTEEVDFGPAGPAQSCEDKGCIEFFC